MKKEKGLLVSIYKSPLGDSTNNGLSSKSDSLLLVGIGIENGPFETSDGEDYLVCEYRERYDDFIATPKSLKDSGKWTMFGGNFAYTSDSRFPGKHPIKIHDRVEA
tara:strand:+ start:4274 stop:4591 length:318 start_codon:yes stop_codon:yes gene_type:complete